MKLDTNWSIPKEAAGFSSSQKGTQLQRFLENSTMAVVAFVVDIAAHLKELHLKRQGQNNMMTTVGLLQEKLHSFKQDLEEEYRHVPKVKEQIQGDIPP